jgi:hypothetical protein
LVQLLHPATSFLSLSCSVNFLATWTSKNRA